MGVKVEVGVFVGVTVGAIEWVGVGVAIVGEVVRAEVAVGFGVGNGDDEEVLIKL